ncbi:molybdenum cofactor guanylyltransferase MobA [Rhodobacter sp. NTK016B]|uniref:molybdenum cofactor guanylyltransferase MobA n=1 Tax=Rhodobacter sp. NTK016B TaxID=2759676 RepID=UPI001A8C0476|nr:molybdenum cofactor guanylyltransferase MobA [Rhodobacter sp. NTK016B]MBN8290700.1 molybdenum cofactor guanylyltransferase MobA [Rhodobacter sp. NTK016B]
MVAAVILAGGQANRMGGGDKPLLMLSGQSLLARVIARIAPQVAALALNANGDPARFAEFRLPVLPDSLPDQPGPLAGILAGLDWAAAQGHTQLLSVPGDTPFLPDDLVTRLSAAPAAIAASGGRAHPVVGLWPTEARHALRAQLAQDERRAMRFAASQNAVEIAFDATPDPFFNVNTPADLRQAEIWT